MVIDRNSSIATNKLTASTIVADNLPQLTIYDYADCFLGFDASTNSIVRTGKGLNTIPNIYHYYISPGSAERTISVPSTNLGGIYTYFGEFRFIIPNKQQSIYVAGGDFY